MARPLASYVLVATVLAAAGCGDRGGYAVVIDAQAADAEAVHIEAALASPCADQPAGGPFEGAVRSIELSRDDTALATFDPVDPGRYGLVARALTASCDVVAWGCRDHELTGGGQRELLVTLAPIDGPTAPRCGDEPDR